MRMPVQVRCRRACQPLVIRHAVFSSRAVLYLLPSDETSHPREASSMVELQTGSMTRIRRGVCLTLSQLGSVSETGSRLAGFEPELPRRVV